MPCHCSRQISRRRGPKANAPQKLSSNVRCHCSLRRTYQKRETPIREALQVLEHAELVFITVDSERPDKWTATSSGLAALARGKDVVRQHISERTGAAPPPKPIVERLQELDNLRSTGLISEAEYTSKRGPIIDEL